MQFICTGRMEIGVIILIIIFLFACVAYIRREIDWKSMIKFTNTKREYLKVKHEMHGAARYGEYS